MGTGNGKGDDDLIPTHGPYRPRLTWYTPYPTVVSRSVVPLPDVGAGFILSGCGTDKMRMVEVLIVNNEKWTRLGVAFHTSLYCFLSPRPPLVDWLALLSLTTQLNFTFSCSMLLDSSTYLHTYYYWLYLYYSDYAYIY